MNNRAVMQQALEALAHAVSRLDHQAAIQDCDDAITSLRAALAESESFHPDWDRVEALQESLREHMAEISRLRAALAEPEPVAHRHEWIRTGAMKPNEMRCLQCGAWGETIDAAMAEKADVPETDFGNMAAAVADEPSTFRTYMREKVARDMANLYEAFAAVAEPVALETVYETIIHWDEGGGKRSRRELARRIAALYAAPLQPEAAAVAEPVASVTECEACFTPDVCQLRGTCDHYAAERLRVAAPPQRGCGA